jgi:Fe-S-cluster-containing dehydrogenase component
MEKCTYCIQRIRTSQIEADRENRMVRDSEIQTACQQSCPTQAIVFGNRNDPNSAVARRKASPLDSYCSKRAIPGRAPATPP